MPNKLVYSGNFFLEHEHVATRLLGRTEYIFENPDLNFNVMDLRGNTPLHHACYGSGEFEVVKFLLKNSSEKGIDISKKNNNLQTAGDLARIKNCKEILELFESMV